MQNLWGVTPALSPSATDPVCPVAGLPAFSVMEAENGRAPVLFASPHSGAHYPQTMQDGLRVPLMDLRRTEDAFVHLLFDGVPRVGGNLLYANYARGYVDLNRSARELDPDMFHDGAPRTAAVPSPQVEAGLGCLPRIAARGEPIYAAPLSREEGEYRLSQVHDAYHGYIRQTLDRFVENCKIAILIDCHSMPSRQPGRRKLADIVLGDRFGSSCDNRLTSVAERAFRKLGYSVARNAPYAGGYTTRCYGRPKRGVHALQIEINRGLYMDESSVTTTERFFQVQQDMADVSDVLVDFARRLIP